MQAMLKTNMHSMYICFITKTLCEIELLALRVVY